MALHLAAAVGLEAAAARAGTGRRRGRRSASRGRRSWVERLWVAVRIVTAERHVALGLAAAIGLEAGPAGAGTNRGSAVRVQPTLGDIALGLATAIALEAGTACGRADRRTTVRVVAALGDVALRLAPVVVLEAAATRSWTSGRRRGGGGGRRPGGWGRRPAHRDVALPGVLVAPRVAHTAALGLQAGPGAGVGVGGGLALALALVVGTAVETTARVKAGFLRRHVAPPLHHGLGHLARVGEGAGAHLLGHVGAGLGGLELGHQLGDVLALHPRLQRTLLLRLL